MRGIVATLNYLVIYLLLFLVAFLSPSTAYHGENKKGQLIHFSERNYTFLSLGQPFCSSRGSIHSSFSSRAKSLLFISPTSRSFKFFIYPPLSKEKNFPGKKRDTYIITHNRFQPQSQSHSLNHYTLYTDFKRRSNMRNRFGRENKKNENDVSLQSSCDNQYEEGAKLSNDDDPRDNVKDIELKNGEKQSKVDLEDKDDHQNNNKIQRDKLEETKRHSSNRKTIKDTLRSLLGNSLSDNVTQKVQKKEKENPTTDITGEVCSLDFEAPCSVPSVSQFSLEEGILVPSTFTVKDTIDFLSQLAKLPKYSNDKLSSPSLDSMMKDDDGKKNHIESASTSLERIFITECGKLLGYVTTLDLLLADKSSFVSEIIRKPEVIVHTDDLFEEALQKMRKSGLTYAPVISEESKIVGIVTPSDMLTEMEYEATDDVMRTSGSGSGESYFGTSIFKIVTARAGWLISLLMLQSVSSTILTKFSTLLEKHLIIALFLTMLTGTAGNAGNQSSAMVIRGLATGEINRQNSHKVLLREVKAGIFMAILLALASFFRVYITPGSNLISTLAVSIAMGITVIGSCILGTLSPLVLEYLGQDPCNCASPALATLTDVSGVLILCLISSLLLG